MQRRTLAAIALGPLLLLVTVVAAPPVVEAGGGCHGPDGSAYTEGSAKVVRMDVCSFSPTIARVDVGTTVRFLNTSTIDHAVVGRSGTWASEILRPGHEFSTTFEAAGTYPYSCPLHPGMVGAMAVGGEVAARAELTTAGEGPSEDVAAAAAIDATQPDWTFVWIGALAGLGAGAIIGVLAVGIVSGRRRPTSRLTTN